MTNRVLFMLGLLVGVLGFLAGCGIMDTMMGFDPETGASTGGIVGAAGTVASPWLPWAGAAAGWLTSFYAALRGRKWKRAASVTFDSLEEFLKTPEGLALEGKIKEYLASKHDAAGVYDFVKAYVERFDH